MNPEGEKRMPGRASEMEELRALMVAGSAVSASVESGASRQPPRGGRVTAPERFCPCNGNCHFEASGPCSFDCFGHDAEMVQAEDGEAHRLVKPDGGCRVDCPHPSHEPSPSASTPKETR